MVAEQIHFVKQALPVALKAGEAFNLNPLVILAQGALESGWGRSVLSRSYNNYFGLTAYGASNRYWHGAKVKLGSGCSALDFRVYATAEDSFYDFARLVRDGYRRAWQMSSDVEAYAKEIAYSPYISELNGDDREAYRRSLVEIAVTIRGIVEVLGEDHSL